MECPKDSRNAAVVALASLLFMPVGEVVRAEEAKKEPTTVKQLMAQDLAGIPGKEVVMLTVEYLPGGSSLPHRHDADVFVYVLEGSIVTQVDGKEPVTLKAGETFHESPTDIHRKSANASSTQSAKFLVLMVKDKGKPATRPVDQK
jgi:quercetin dioxygenase-like cupin family protein